MKKGSNILKLQNLFRVSQSELFVVFVILAGLLIGAVYRFVDGRVEGTERVRDEIYYILDSLADAQKTTYIGSSLSGNYDEELSKADTVMKEELSFSTNAKLKSSSHKININTASKSELMKIPQVGEKTALAIIAYRKDTPFVTIEDIMNIKGIGRKKFEKMKDYISVK
jgi:comEA protein